MLGSGKFSTESQCLRPGTKITTLEYLYSVLFSAYQLTIFKSWLEILQVLEVHLVWCSSTFLEDNKLLIKEELL